MINLNRKLHFLLWVDLGKRYDILALNKTQQAFRKPLQEFLSMKKTSFLWEDKKHIGTGVINQVAAGTSDQQTDHERGSLQSSRYKTTKHESVTMLNENDGFR